MAVALTTACRVAAAGLLLFAACAKLVSQLSGGTGERGLFAASTLLPMAELGLAAWVVSGLAQAASAFVVGLMFLLFAVVSLEKAALGSSSCGCYGAIQVPPHLSALADLGLAGALFATARLQRRVSPPLASGRLGAGQDGEQGRGGRAAAPAAL